MLAIISDIHSNKEALQAVLEDIRQRQITSIACLGDIIGYGPNPGECLDLIREHCDYVIMGNHDFAVLYEPTRFNPGAEDAVFWTRAKLESEPDSELIGARWDYLAGLNIREVIPGDNFGVREIQLVHGSPRRPINEYLFPDDIYNNTSKIASILERVENVCFIGHTHVPGIVTENLEFISPDDFEGEFELSPGKTIVNVGSVGQPRDRNPQACYAILNDGKVSFSRVEYDANKTASKVQAIENLNDYLGERLLEGK